MIRAGVGRYPYNRGHVIVALDWWAYGDESGLHESPLYTLMVGYAGPPDVWDSFRVAWTAVVNKEALPRFHARKFFGGKGPYRVWSGQRRTDFLDSLLRIVAQHNIVPMGWAINVADFLALNQSERLHFTGGQIISKYETVLSKDGGINSTLSRTLRQELGATKQVYRMALIHFLLDVFHGSPPGCSIHVVLDAQDTLAAGARQLFRESITRGGQPQLGNRTMQSLTYTGSAGEPALQAADLLAYLAGKRVNGASLDEREQQAWEAVIAKGAIRIANAAFMRKVLESFRSSLNQENIRYGFPLGHDIPL